MNDIHDDAHVIARLRSALDELTAPDDFAAPGEELPRLRRTMTPARWMAVAAAGVLVVGAVVAVAVNRSNQSDVASTPTTAPSTLPATTLSPTETTLVRVETKWFTIISPDLVPGERTFEECCRASLPGPLLTMAWSSGDSFLTLTEYPNGPTTDVFPDANSTIRTTGSATLLFRSVGLTSDERENLADQVVAGSGLPYVLPVEGWGLAALGHTAGESRLLQLYTPLNTDPLSSYLPTVTMSVGEYRGELDLLGQWPDGKPVVVAGYEGWAVTDLDGHVTVFWETGDGNWATMRIDATLADRNDGLIAAVVEVDPTEPTVDTVLAP